MNITAASNATQEETARQLCAEIRQHSNGKWYTFAGLQCWGCLTFSKGDPSKMCFASQPDYLGCNLVNARLAQRLDR